MTCQYARSGHRDCFKSELHRPVGFIMISLLIIGAKFAFDVKETNPGALSDVAFEHDPDHLEYIVS